MSHPMTHPENDDALIRRVLTDCRRIALVGASPKAQRDSHHVMGFLLQRGYQVYPVNPVAAGQRIHGQPVSANLADLTEPVDLVDIFRRSEDAGAIVDEAIAHKERLGIQAVWLQLGVVDQAAKDRAEAAGLSVVMDRCPAIEIPRLAIPPMT